MAIIATFVVGLFFFQPASPDIKKQAAARNAENLQKAIEAFHDDYRNLPVAIAPGDEFLTEGPQGIELLTVLLGREKAGPQMKNPREIAYINSAPAKHRAKGGLIYDSETNLPAGFYDSWGNPFHVRFSGPEEEIKDPLKARNVIRGKIVIVYSHGRDGKPGGGDDVKTW